MRRRSERADPSGEALKNRRRRSCFLVRAPCVTARLCAIRQRQRRNRPGHVVRCDAVRPEGASRSWEIGVPDPVVRRYISASIQHPPSRPTVGDDQSDRASSEPASVTLHQPRTMTRPALRRAHRMGCPATDRRRRPSWEDVQGHKVAGLDQVPQATSGGW